MDPESFYPCSEEPATGQCIDSDAIYILTSYFLKPILYDPSTPRSSKWFLSFSISE